MSRTPDLVEIEKKINRPVGESVSSTGRFFNGFDAKKQHPKPSNDRPARLLGNSRAALRQPGPLLYISSLRNA
jgi:hypothetical protein